MNFIVIMRKEQNEKQTIGKLKVLTQKHAWSFDYKTLFECYSLELPDKNNETFVSRIPADTYQCVKRWSDKHKWHILIKDVEGRTWILIHSGNFYTEIKGCVLVGDKLSDINQDGFKDVTDSRETLDRILELLPEEFELQIFDEEN